MLAWLNYGEAGTDIEQHHLTKLNTSACTAGNCTVSALTNLTPISWQDLEEASDSDSTALRNLVVAGTLTDKSLRPPELLEYHRHRDHLTTAGPVVLYKDRAVVPAGLRREVLQVLHSTHQGVTSMVSRATTAVFWPCMQEDITRTRQVCTGCDANTPSQPVAPPHPLATPSYPFEMVSSDYFTYAGKHFLIVVDRYSGWLSVYPAGSDGAASLVRELRCHFTTLGISSQLSSDGGPEYTAHATQKFLKEWKASFRLSSAYFPHSNQRAEVGVRRHEKSYFPSTTPFLRSENFHKSA